MKKVALHNLGCKVNAYETEAMQEMLEHAGYEIVPFQEGADIYVINTCTVTNIADRKSRQMLHRARKMNPDAVVVAAGCYVQAQAEKQVIDPCIDIVLGNNKKQDLLTALQAYEEAHGDLREVIDINHTAEVTDLAKNGYQEVVLTGIHLSSYGIDFENEDNLLSLIRAVHEIEGIKRIRLGSLEPRIITEEFVQAIAALPKMCPHFHLSLQSGCNETLKRMNRRYTSEEFYEKCEILRKYFEKPALTTDVIVGFPQETEEEFETTYEFLKKICFYETHIFKYSKREGTKAAVMQGQIPEQIKAKRSARLIELGEKNRRAYEESFLGKTVEVLVEEKSDVNGKEMWTGHTKEYMKIALESEKNLQNCILNVQIKDGREIIH